MTFGYLSDFFDRAGRPMPATTLYEASGHDALVIASVPRLPIVVGHLRELLGSAEFDELAREGAAMDRSQAVAYAHTEIQRARDELGEPRA